MTDNNNPFAHLIPKPQPPTVTESTQIPQTNNPLTTLLGDPTPPKIERGSAHELGGKEELASINTESIEPKTEVSSGLMRKVAERTKELTLDSSIDVRGLCDHIDKLIESNNQLAGPPLFELRNAVSRLMVTLKIHPEFDSVLIDKDVRNVMQFIRATREEAEGLRAVKTEKKAVRVAKKEAKTAKLAGFEEAFSKVMLGSFGKTTK